MKNYLLILCLVSWQIFFCQTVVKESPFQVAFYNLENLFDTINDPLTDDYEFLPTSQHRWNTERYTQKIHNLARSIASIGNWQGPDVLGVCEVEHKSCLLDLTKKTSLNQFNYEVIHQESSDKRGIDVACMYKKDKFELINYQYLKINFSFDTKPTRDILYVKGKALGKDTVHIFYSHWPSRMGGVAESEPKRIVAANTLKACIDSILSTNQLAKIIVSGDFNDGTTSQSIYTHLKADHSQEVNEKPLFNTSHYLAHTLHKGSHKYQDEWNLFDQIIISKILSDTNETMFCYPKTSKIHDDKVWLNESDSFSNGQKPKRNFVGTQYNNGYSDHYAVSLTFWLK